MAAQPASESQKKLFELLDLLRDVSERRYGPEWGIETLGDVAVFGAGGGVAARVVVDEDERCRTCSQCRPEHFARVHQARCEGSLGDHGFSAHAMPAVEQDCEEALLRGEATGQVGRRESG